MKNFLIPLAVGLVLLVVGTTTGVILEKHRSHSTGKIRYLDYQISIRKGAFSRPVVPGKRLEVLLDGKPIEELSTVSVQIFNQSDRDFEDVRIYVELQPVTDEEIQVVSQTAVGVGDLPEAVRVMQELKASSVRGAVRYGYVVSAINRSDILDPSFEATYFLLGVTSPAVSVKTDRRGVKLRRFSYPEGTVFGVVLRLSVLAVALIGGLGAVVLTRALQGVPRLLMRVSRDVVGVWRAAFGDAETTEGEGDEGTPTAEPARLAGAPLQVLVGKWELTYTIPGRKSGTEVATIDGVGRYSVKDAVRFILGDVRLDASRQQLTFSKVRLDASVHHTEVLTVKGPNSLEGCKQGVPEHTLSYQRVH